MEYYILLRFFKDEPPVVYPFFPGEKDINSCVNHDLGNWFKIIPSTFSFDELRQKEKVTGMIQLEGGNSMISISGSCIFETKSDAALHYHDPEYHIIM